MLHPIFLKKTKNIWIDFENTSVVLCQTESLDLDMQLLSYGKI